MSGSGTVPVVWPELDFAGLLLMVAVFLGVRGSLADGWPVLVGLQAVAVFGGIGTVSTAVLVNISVGLHV